MNLTYQNPVYDHPFADPFVLKYCGEYWAYCTGAWTDGRWFGVLRSRDLIHWEEVGGAMEPLRGAWPCQWAPEVSYDNGRFYLYYSVGDEATMQIRVAVAHHPAGPFIDSGRRLTEEPFAIDAHVFADDDGARYLFYATDYLDHDRVGTGTARDRMVDPQTLAGQPRPVSRARYDWQIYDPNRVEKGGVRWHTIEGPFVLKRKGRYYQMFSGGNWQNPSYGVSYAVAEQVDGDEEWSQTADGDTVRPILRTLSGLVVGPGHNSAVRGPDNRQLVCVYHRWAADASARVMAIDPLDWAGERMLLIGPSIGPSQLSSPTAVDFFDGEDAMLDPDWRTTGGRWRARGGQAMQPLAESARAVCGVAPASYLAEVSIRALDPSAEGGYGVALGEAAELLLQPALGRALGRVRRAGAWEERALALPEGFVFGAYHLLRAEVNAGWATLSLDEAALRWEVELPQGEPAPLALCTEGAPAAFAGFALTGGWEDRFEQEGAEPSRLGWGGAGDGWRVAGGALRAEAGAGPLIKAALPAAYRLAVSAALPEAGGSYSIYPAARGHAMGPELRVSAGPGGPSLSYTHEGGAQELPLPAGADLSRPHLLELRVGGERLAIAWEGQPLGEVPAPAWAGGLGLAADGQAAFDMVRVTAAA